jgi:hypothetical protein
MLERLILRYTDAALTDAIALQAKPGAPYLVLADAIRVATRNL